MTYYPLVVAVCDVEDSKSFVSSSHLASVCLYPATIIIAVGGGVSMRNEFSL